MSFKLLTRKGECYQKHTIEIGKNFSSNPLEIIKQMYYYIGIKTFGRCGLYLLEIKEAVVMKTSECDPETLKVLNEIKSFKNPSEILMLLSTLIEKEPDKLENSNYPLSLIR